MTGSTLWGNCRVCCSCFGVTRNNLGPVSNGYQMFGSILKFQPFSSAVLDQDAITSFQSGQMDLDTIKKLKDLIKKSRLNESLGLLGYLHENGSPVDDYVYVGLLHLCVKLKCFTEAKCVHSNIVINRFQPNVMLSNSLINLYGKSKYVKDARHLFDAMAVRDVFSWTVMIETYAKCGYPVEALNLFREMNTSDVEADEICLLSVLKSCAICQDVKQGNQVYVSAIINGLTRNVHISSSLIDMYCKCGSLEDAFKIFVCMPNRDVVVWNMMLTGYGENNELETAIKLSRQMKEEAVFSNGFTFFSILQACNSVNQCMHVHAIAINSDMHLDSCFFNCLINMYHKHGASTEACETFKRMSSRDVITWNSMLSGCVQQGLCEQAFEIFEQMIQQNLTPDCITLSTMLKGCTSMAALSEGREVHCHIYKIGMKLDKFIASTLIDMYGKCGELEDAYSVFKSICDRDVVTWNSIISVVVKHDLTEYALELFKDMRSAGLEADDATFVCTLKACAFLSDLEQGKMIHSYIMESGIHSNIVQNTLIDMYGKCQSLNDARAVFDKIPKHDVVSWNVMIMCYSQNDHLQEAMNLFLQMLHADVKPDKVSFLAILKVCANSGVHEHGIQIHSCINRAGFGCDVTIMNALIDMYVKCGIVDTAHQIFSEATERDVVSWNTIITAHFQEGLSEKVYASFLQLLLEGIEPNEVTFVAVLKACANLSTIDNGKQIHVQVKEALSGSDAFVNSTLVDMYAKSGSIEDASILFQKFVSLDTASCNTMIAAYAQHGLIDKVTEMFDKMYYNYVAFDHITYVVVISACSHMGLVEEGYKYFLLMRVHDGLIPSLELYACLADLLGRAGHLSDAVLFSENMHCQPNAEIWTILLSACKFHNDDELALTWVKYVLEIEPDNSAVIILMSNLYSLSPTERDDCVQHNSFLDSNYD